MAAKEQNVDDSVRRDVEDRKKVAEMERKWLNRRKRRNNGRFIIEHRALTSRHKYMHKNKVHNFKMKKIPYPLWNETSWRI